MSRRLAPWQIIGTNNSAEVTSAREMMNLAGLDWIVSLEDVYAAGRYDPLVIKDRFATVRRNRDDSESVLSVVGSRYQVFQNHEVFNCLDELVGTGQVKYSAAGELGGGKVVWTVLELPENINIGDDEHSGYIVARTSHDGSSPFQMTPIVSRLSCTNQINAAMASGKESGLYYSLRHNTNNKFDINDIKVQLKLMYDDIQNYAEVGSYLRNILITDQEFSNYLAKVYPLHPKLSNYDGDMLTAGEKRTKSKVLLNRANAMLVWMNKTDTQHNIYGTAYGAFQAVVEGVDHLSRNTTKQAEKTILGTDNVIKSRALSLLV